MKTVVVVIMVRSNLLSLTIPVHVFSRRLYLDDIVDHTSSMSAKSVKSSYHHWLFTPAIHGSRSC
jgi:hypothetical protein